MASLWKDDRSPHHVACVTCYVGKRRCQLKKATGTKDRRLATRIALELEEVAQGRRTTEQALAFLDTVPDLRAQRATRRAMDDLLRRATGRGLGSKSLAAYVRQWLERTQGSVRATTFDKYQHVGRLLVDSVGRRAEAMEVAELTQDDVRRFRDDRAKTTSAATANLALRIVRILLNAAEVDGLVSSNVARHVKPLKRGDEKARRAFTEEEVRRMLTVADDEWRSMILVGLYSGARLKDVALLTWANVDLAEGELRFTASKTAKAAVLPLHPALRRHLEALAGDDPRAPLHPRAAAIVRRQGRAAMVSRQFVGLLATAGLRVAAPHVGRGKGRDGAREGGELSFHCLRHSLVSWLKARGTSDAVARDLAGHASAEVNRVYTHLPQETRRAAIDQLPDVTRAGI